MAPPETPQYRFSVTRLLRLLMLPLVIVGGVVAWRYFSERADERQVRREATPGLPPADATVAGGTTAPADGRTPTAAGGRATATPSRGAATPTPVPRGPAVVVAYDSFPSYHTWAYAARKGYGQGIDLQARGFGLEEDSLTEDEKYARLRAGRYQALITTLDSCALHCDDTMLVPFVIDESAGADEWYVREPLRTFNDLVGRSVCFTDRSVSHAMYLAIGATLDLLDTMRPVPLPDVNAALDTFLAGGCDAVIAWQPNTLAKLFSGGALKPGVVKLTDSSRFRFVLDVAVFNRAWATEKPEQAQAAVEAYFRALRDVQDSPENVAAFLLDSFKDVRAKDGGTWSDWSGIRTKEDLRAQLGAIAQATLAHNRLAMSDPNVLASRLAEMRGFWSRGGVQGATTEPAQLVDNRLLARVADSPALSPNAPPVNATFTLATRITMPRLTEAELGRAQEVAKLPVEKISFRPDSFELLPVSQRALLEIAELLRRTPGLYLFIEGRAAKPLGAPPQETITVAANRATAVANFLAAQPGIDVNRLVILYPKTDAELRQTLRFYDSARESELEQDRLVLFTLRRPGGQ
jgi:outer membrane protein OmpA-like peptidoglycan-associated protein